MSYIGVGHKFQYGARIIVKIHGPLDAFDIDVNKLRQRLIELARKYNAIPIDDLLTSVAEELKEEYCDGKYNIWVQLDYESHDGEVRGVVAEKVLVS